MKISRDGSIGAVLLVASLGAHAFEGEITYRLEERGRTRPLHYMVNHDGRVRFEGEGERGISILDPATGRFLILLSQQRRYQIISSGHSPAANGSLQRGPVLPTAFERTEHSEIVAGHRCDVYRYRGASEMIDICAAIDLGRGIALHHGPAAAWQLSPAMRAGFGHPDFFPLKVVARRGDGSPITMEAVSLNRHPLDDALFEPPEGYRQAPVSAQHIERD